MNADVSVGEGGEEDDVFKEGVGVDVGRMMDEELGGRQPSTL